MTQPRKLRKISWPEMPWRNLLETEIESQMTNKLWSKLFDISHGPGGMYQIIGGISFSRLLVAEEILKTPKAWKL